MKQLFKNQVYNCSERDRVKQQMLPQNYFWFNVIFPRNMKPFQTKIWNAKIPSSYSQKWKSWMQLMSKIQIHTSSETISVELKILNFTSGP